MAESYESMAIVGVGLIGGSIGLAARQFGVARHVLGYGRREQSLEVARQRGAITYGSTDLKPVLAQAELIVVCTPVESVVERVQQAVRLAPTALITDVASTKSRIVHALEDCAQFVGGHPLAGGQASGCEAASAELFLQRQVILTPTARSDPGDVGRLREFWQNLGAVVSLMDCQQHDRLLAATSHLPHLMASALAAATPSEALPWVASGWADTTRVAAGDVELWTQILLDNRQHVTECLDALSHVLQAFRTGLVQADGDGLRQLLERGKTHRDTLAG